MSVARYAAVGFSFWAVSIAMQWLDDDANKPTKKLRTFLCATATAVGAYHLFKALGGIKIGIRRHLGTVLHDNKRRLGLLERWYVAHSRAGHHTGFSVAMELVSMKCNNIPTVKQLERILNRVARQFPWLRVKVRRDGVEGVDSRESLLSTSDGTTGSTMEESLWGDDLYVTVDSEESKEYCTVREVTIHKDDAFGTAGGLATILEQEGRTEWHDEDPNAPLWRAVLVKYESSNKFALVLSFHHLITDGMGAIAVCQAIVQESGAAVNTAANPMQHSVLPPPMEDVLNTVPCLSHLLVPVLMDRFPCFTSILRPPHFQGMSHNQTTMANDRSSIMVCLCLLNEKQTLVLQNYCRRMKVTVNSICVAALSRAISRHVEENPTLFSSSPGLLPNGKGVRLKIITAVNERPDCGLQNKDLGVYLTGPQVFVESSHESSAVEIASLYQTKLLAARSAARMDIGLCKFISEDWIQFSQKHADREPNGREDSIEVSNLGRVSFDAGSSGSWSVEALWFAQGRKVTGPALTVTMVTSTGGLKAVLSAVPQAYSRKSLVAIGESFQHELMQLFDEQNK